MYRAIALFASILISGCFSIGIEAWDNSGSPSQGSCPESDYDNGGNVKPEPGLCKMGTGALVSINRRF